MDLLLIISIIYMYCMTKNYNTHKRSYPFIIDVLVQIFHIIILFFILRNLFIYGGVLPYLFLPLHLWGIHNNIRCLILNLFGKSSDENKRQKNKDDNYEDEW